MGCGPSKDDQTNPLAVRASMVPELDRESDGMMRVEECIGAQCSGRPMDFHWNDSVCPLVEMTDPRAGPTELSPARVALGHGYSIEPAHKPPNDDQRLYMPADGSVVMSLAIAGRVAIHGPTGRVLILEKDNDASSAPRWYGESGTNAEKTSETKAESSSSSKRTSSTKKKACWWVHEPVNEHAELKEGDETFEFDGDTFRKRANITIGDDVKNKNAPGGAQSSFVYCDGDVMRWLATGTFSRLSPHDPSFRRHEDDVDDPNDDPSRIVHTASLGEIQVEDIATGSVIAVFSGVMKGPKHVRVAKHTDVPALIAFSLAACFWWDDEKVKRMAFGKENKEAPPKEDGRADDGDDNERDDEGTTGTAQRPNASSAGPLEPEDAETAPSAAAPSNGEASAPRRIETPDAATNGEAKEAAS